MTHILANLGWVDFDFGCSTLSLVLSGLIGRTALAEQLDKIKIDL